MKKLSKNTVYNLSTYGIVIVAYLIVQGIVLAGGLSNQIRGQLVPICVYISLAISLNLVSGVSGELSLGHAGFMSVGAFSGVIVAAALRDSGMGGVPILIISMIVGGVISGIAGLIIGIPVLRLRGDYLAIVTLAFGEIIKNIVNNLYVAVDSRGLHFSMTSAEGFDLAEGGRVVINGPMGATGITKLASFTMGVVLIIFTLFVVLGTINSRHGRAIMAARDNRIAADSVGISVTRCKLLAFTVAAVLAGMAGALYAMNYSTVAAKKFDFNTSILILVFVVLGGMGNIRGSIIAAAILTLLPELLRSVADYRMLVYAIVLILVMLARNSTVLKNYINNVVNGIVSRIKAPFSGRNGGKGGASE